MKQDLVRQLCGAFDAITRTEQGTEFWLARELQPHLGYDRWENFANAIDRAKAACRNSGQGVDDHFRYVTKMVDLGTEPSREIDDVALSKSPLRGR